MDYKQIAIQHHLLHSNLKQRLDLASRSLDTIDFRIQLELHHQRGLKSILEKYEDPKYDQAFQFIITEASNQQQVQENLIAEMAHARAEFSEQILQHQTRLKANTEERERLHQKIKQAHQKQQQSQSFYFSINRVFERNVAALDFVNDTLDLRLGHLKVVQDLQKNKENTYGNYRIATEKFNQVLQDSIPEFEKLTQQLRELDKDVADTLKQFQLCIVLAQVSAMRNRQYDLDQINRFLERVDYTKMTTVFKFNDELYHPISPEPVHTFLTRPMNELVIHYDIFKSDPLPPWHQIPLEQEQKQVLDLACSQFLAKEKDNQIKDLIPEIEKFVSKENSIEIVNTLANSIKAPIAIAKPLAHLMNSFFCKILDCIPKDGPAVQRLQRMCTFLHSQNSAQETFTVFQVVSQHPTFSRKNEYWEWLLYWQLREMCEGLSEGDKRMMILQQFQVIVQQMAKLRIQTQVIKHFVSELAPHYGLKQVQIEDVNKMLAQFIRAHNCEPTSKGQLQAFDCVE